jgi:hypothetical protein
VRWARHLVRLPVSSCSALRSLREKKKASRLSRDPRPVLVPCHRAESHHTDVIGDVIGGAQARWLNGDSEVPG